MFCTQCGTQIGQGQNFCKNCGTRVGKAPEPITTAPLATPEPTRASPSIEPAPRASAAPVAKPSNQSMPLPNYRERQGIGMTVIVAGVVVVILAAAAGIYFGTDLLRAPAKEETPVAAQAPLVPETKAPADALWEETKNSKEAGDNNLASAPQSQQPESPPPASVESPPPEVLPKPAPKADVPSSPRRSQTQRAGQDVPASRRSIAAGTYQTLRSTPVFESPSAAARVVANIPGGIQVNVVAANGDWLEVHSKRGNPPGFIRRQDASFVAKAE